MSTEPYDPFTPEHYAASPALAGWPWCAPGEFPISFEYEAPCLPVEVCLHGATLWSLRDCIEPTPEVATVAEVAVRSSEPITLPVTGSAEVAGTALIGTACLLLGLGLTKLAKRGLS